MEKSNLKWEELETKISNSAIEENEILENRVFILSAFPEFLLDYFGVKLWKTCVKHTMNFLEKCGCKRV